MLDITVSCQFKPNESILATWLNRCQHWSNGPLVYHFVPASNVSATLRWIAIKFCRGIHGPHRINPDYFGIPMILEFPVSSRAIICPNVRLSKFLILVFLKIRINILMSTTNKYPSASKFQWLCSAAHFMHNRQQETFSKIEWVNLRCCMGKSD